MTNIHAIAIVTDLDISTDAAPSVSTWIVVTAAQILSDLGLAQGTARRLDVLLAASLADDNAEIEAPDAIRMPTRLNGRACKALRRALLVLGCVDPSHLCAA